MNQNANNPFGSFNDEGLEASRDTLGGSRIFDSGIYDGVIKLAFAGEAKSGAKSVTVHVEIDGREYRETVYVTSGKAKGGKHYYEKDGKKNPLPGYTVANDIALMATGMPLSEQDIEEKVVKLWDFDAKAEVPTKVQAITSLHGKPITLGILKQIEDKNVQDSSGNYIPSGDTRETNVIDKVFHTESGRTAAEVIAKATTGEFKDKWADANSGKVRDRSTGTVGKVGAPGKRAANDGSAKAPSKSLFGG